SVVQQQRRHSTSAPPGGATSVDPALVPVGFFVRCRDLCGLSTMDGRGLAALLACFTALIVWNGDAIPQNPSCGSILVARQTAVGLSLVSLLRRGGRDVQRRHRGVLLSQATSAAGGSL